MLTAVAKPEMKKAGKMMRIFSKKDVSKKDDSKKDDVKYDRKEVKQPLSAATAKTKTSTLKKVGGWKWSSNIKLRFHSWRMLIELRLQPVK